MNETQILEKSLEKKEEILGDKNNEETFSPLCHNLHRFSPNPLPLGLPQHFGWQNYIIQNTY